MKKLYVSLFFVSVIISAAGLLLNNPLITLPGGFVAGFFLIYSLGF
ncbi:MAG: hypothetical protein ABIJ92_05200 [Candidatus Aenigmatarchaeota archaeon]